MKLVVIGGGSSYTAELIEGVILHKDSLPITEVVLIDVEMGLDKVRINTEFARRMVKKAGLPIQVSYTLNRKEGLKDAAFVITQLRVGGLDARAKDERIPLTYGVIGQETTGPGGCFKAFRTIPVLLDICKDMEQVCPDAWLINFTNPAGIVTEAVLKYTKVKCIGLCNVSINMKHDAAQRLQVDAEELDCRFIGLNHLSVMNHAFYQGADRIEEVLAVSNRESVVKNIEKNDEMDTLAREMGCMFSPYLQYFYSEKEMLKKETREKKAIDANGSCTGQLAGFLQEILKDVADKSMQPESDGKKRYQCGCHGIPGRGKDEWFLYR